MPASACHDPGRAEMALHVTHAGVRGFWTDGHINLPQRRFPRWRWGRSFGLQHSARRWLDGSGGDDGRSVQRERNGKARY
jgi:hypothetical protein